MKKLLAILLSKSTLITVSAVTATLLVTNFVIVPNLNKDSSLSDNVIMEEIEQDSDEDISQNDTSSEAHLSDIENLDDKDKDDQSGESYTLTNLVRPTITPIISLDSSSNASNSNSSSGSSNSSGSSGSEKPQPIFSSTILKNIAAISMDNIDVVDKGDGAGKGFDATKIQAEITSVIGSSGIAIDSMEYNESLNKLVVTLSKSGETTTVVLENQGIVVRNYVNLDLNETTIKTLLDREKDETAKYGIDYMTYLTPVEGYTASQPDYVPYVSYSNQDRQSGNFTFLGWYTQSTGGELFDFANTVVTEPLTLYAHWAQNVIATDGESVSAHASKFQNTLLSANAAASANIDVTDTDLNANDLWKATGITEPTTIELFNSAGQILYTTETDSDGNGNKVPVTTNISWAITTTTTANGKTIFDLTGTVGLPTGYTWVEEPTSGTKTITNTITIDVVAKVSSLCYEQEVLKKHTYAEGLTFMNLTELPTQETTYAPNSEQTAHMEDNLFGGDKRQLAFILENGDIVEDKLADENCTCTATFYPATGSSLAYVDFVVTVDPLPTGYEWADEHTKSLTITTYIEAPLTVTTIKMPSIGREYTDTLNESYTISLSDTYLDWESSKEQIIDENKFIELESEQDVLDDFFIILKRWHMNVKGDPYGVSISHSSAQRLPGIASDGKEIAKDMNIPNDGIPVTWTIDTSKVHKDTRIGTYVVNCELNKDGTLLGYDLTNSNPNTLTITLEVTAAVPTDGLELNNILTQEPILEDPMEADTDKVDEEMELVDSNTLIE